MRRGGREHVAEPLELPVVDGAVVVVRPDHYVSGVFGLDEVERLNEFFAGVLLDASGEELAAALERHGARVVPAAAMSTIPHVDDETLLERTRALIAAQFSNLMDYLQTLFGFFNAPLFATFILGMFSGLSGYENSSPRSHRP